MNSSPNKPFGVSKGDDRSRKDVMIFSLRLVTSAFAACACLQLSSALAQGFPNPGKPIRIIVPFPPGGTSDIHARHVASKLGPALGASVIVENKPGASTIIGAMAVVKAEPDGHTLLYTLSLTVAANPHLFSKLPYDPIGDFTPITYACNGPTVLAVSISLPVNNFRELIEHARKNPGKLNFGSWSPGGTGQLNGELLKEFAGIDIVHVPYKGSADLVQALASGQVQMAFDGLFTARTLQKAGKVKIVAIADDKRALAAPEVPTMAEAGVPGAYVSGGYHFFGPANLPRAIVARLNAELVKVLRMQDVNEMYTSTGMEIVASTPEEQVVILRSQSERQGSIIRKLGIKLD
jgi:tripartite-type tricarboxylate transporter receptor subunit TctC